MDTNSRISGTWRPLLKGELRHDAEEAIQDIARDLARPFESWDNSRPDDPNGIRFASLALGRAGVALFFAQLARHYDDASFGQLAERFVDEAVERMADSTMDASLYCGFPGVAWVYALVVDDDDPAEDASAEIDHVLIESLERSPWPGCYDLVDGLSGIGVYFLSRLRWPAGQQGTALAVRRLAELAETHHAGVTWPSSLLRAPPESPGHNLGVAHGVPGVIGFLGLCVAAGIAIGESDELLGRATSWLWGQRQSNAETGYVFSHQVGQAGSRSAWCYGDPGIAAALLNVARRTNDADLEAQALRVACVAAKRPPEQSGVHDAGLCHGAVGLAHVFNRLYQATGDDVMRNAALTWYQQTLSYRRANAGVGGYQAWSRERVREGEWIDDGSWLTGSAGIGLALLAGVSEQSPCWDRAMLIDIEPAAVT